MLIFFLWNYFLLIIIDAFLLFCKVVVSFTGAATAGATNWQLCAKACALDF